MNVDFELIQANERSELRETIIYFFVNVFFSSLAVKTSARNKNKAIKCMRLCAFVLHKNLQRINIWYIDICTYDNWRLEFFFLKIFFAMPTTYVLLNDNSLLDD